MYYKDNLRDKIYPSSDSVILNFPESVVDLTGEENLHSLNRVLLKFTGGLLTLGLEKRGSVPTYLTLLFGSTHSTPLPKFHGVYQYCSTITVIPQSLYSTIHNKNGKRFLGLLLS